jgi:hypothetical protein
MKTLMKLLAALVLVPITFGFVNNNNDADGYRSIPNGAFSYGEELHYRVHYGFLNAARVKIKVHDKPAMVNGRKTFVIDAVGHTISAFDYMFKVRDSFKSYVDQESVAPLLFKKAVQEDKYYDTDEVFFDHPNKKLKGKKKDMEMPIYVQDIVSGMFYARTIDFTNAKVGQTYPLNIYLDQEIYNLKFKFLGRERIKTDLGRINCIKLRPQLVADRVFKDEEDMTIWVSDDANKIPIKVESKIYVGSVKASITSAKSLRNPFSSKDK